MQLPQIDPVTSIPSNNQILKIAHSDDDEDLQNFKAGNFEDVDILTASLKFDGTRTGNDLKSMFLFIATSHYLTFKNKIMKSKIILGSLLLMFTASNSFSQADSKVSNGDYAMAMVNDIRGSLTKKTTTDASSLVNVKVKKSFVRNFLGASGLTWEINGKNLYATFRKDNLLTCALFKKNGTLIWSVVFVPAQKLPAYLMEMVKSEYLVKGKYSNYAITLAAQAQFAYRNIWILKLENEKEILTLRAENDNLELLETAKK